MKILYVTTISNTVNTFLIPHIRELILQGHQVDIACNVVQKINLELIKFECKVYNVEFQRSPIQKGNFKAYKKIKEVVLENGYELVHTHTPIASFITRLALRNNPNLKIIYTAHGFHFFKGAPLKNWLIYYPLEKISAKFTDAIITINQEDYESAMKMKLKKENAIFKVNGVGINLNKFSQKGIKEKMRLRYKYGYDEDQFVLFFAAELNQNKHQDLLIKVIRILKDKIPTIKLLLAGEGPLEEQYKAQVKMLGIEDHVNFLGYRRDIPEILQLSDIAVSSSRREGLPVNILEAMATGLPLVVTDCRGNRDLVINGKNGYIVKTKGLEQFADSILEIYESKKLQLAFSEKNLEFVRKYSIERALNELKDIYKFI